MSEPMATVGGLKLCPKMCSQHRLCRSCDWPHMAFIDARDACPRCGRPSTNADAVDRETARRLRVERGLIP
jgi:predicted amidophosphoribosyltransferase